MNEEEKKKNEFNGPNNNNKILTPISTTYSNEKTPTGRATSPITSTYQEDLNNYTEAQRRAQIASLDQARTTALQSLKEQEQQIKPTYQNARNTTSAISQKNARNFGEYLANRGLANSGAAAQGEMNRQSTLLNNLGNIDIQEANAYRDIANQRQQIQNNYANGVANVNAGIDATYYNNLLNYNEQQRQMIDQLNAQALGRYANNYYGAYQDYIRNGGNPNDMTALRLLANSGNKQAQITANSIANGANLVGQGIINYNTAGGAGMTIPEATQYYNNLQARQQAQAQAEAEALQRQLEQQNFENYIKQQQLDNATALNKSNIAKNNAQSANYYDQINKRTAGSSNSSSSNNSKSLVSLNTHKEQLNYIIDPEQQIEYIMNANQHKDANGNQMMNDADAIEALVYIGRSDIAQKLLNQN